MSRDWLKAHAEPFRYWQTSPGADHGKRVGAYLIDDAAAVGLSEILKVARPRAGLIYLSGSGADETISDYAIDGQAIFSHSSFNGVFPQNLSTLFPWHGFYYGTQRNYLMKEELVAGSHGVEGRYPFLDPKVVQEYLWLTPELKNSEYKRPVADYLRSHAFPNAWKRKIGFNVDIKPDRNKRHQERQRGSIESPPHTQCNRSSSSTGDGTRGGARGVSGSAGSAWLSINTTRDKRRLRRWHEPFQLHVVFATDSAHFPALTAALHSLLQADVSEAPQDVTVNLFVPRADVEFARQMVRCVRKESSMKRSSAAGDERRRASVWRMYTRAFEPAEIGAHYLQHQNSEAWVAKKGNLAAPSNFARFYLPQLLPPSARVVLYVDADVVFTCDAVAGLLLAADDVFRSHPKAVIAAAPQRTTNGAYVVDSQITRRYVANAAAFDYADLSALRDRVLPMTGGACVASCATESTRTESAWTAKDPSWASRCQQRSCAACAECSTLRNLYDPRSKIPASRAAKVTHFLSQSSFNAGLFLVHMPRWRAMNATGELVNLLSEHAAARAVPGKQTPWPADRVTSQSPMLLVFAGERRAPLSFRWNSAAAAKVGQCPNRRPTDPIKCQSYPGISMVQPAPDPLVRGCEFCAWHWAGYLKPWKRESVEDCDAPSWHPGPSCSDDSAPQSCVWHHFALPQCMGGAVSRMTKRVPPLARAGRGRMHVRSANLTNANASVRSAQDDATNGFSISAAATQANALEAAQLMDKVLQDLHRPAVSAPIDRKRQMETEKERSTKGGQAFFNRTGGCAIRVHGNRDYWEKKACLLYQSVMLASSSTVSPTRPLCCPHPDPEELGSRTGLCAARAKDGLCKVNTSRTLLFCPVTCGVLLGACRMCLHDEGSPMYAHAKAWMPAASQSEAERHLSSPFIERFRGFDIAIVGDEAAIPVHRALASTLACERPSAQKQWYSGPRRYHLIRSACTRSIQLSMHWSRYLLRAKVSVTTGNASTAFERITTTGPSKQIELNSSFFATTRLVLVVIGQSFSPRDGRTFTRVNRHLESKIDQGHLKNQLYAWNALMLSTARGLEWFDQHMAPDATVIWLGHAQPSAGSREDMEREMASADRVLAVQLTRHAFATEPTCSPLRGCAPPVASQIFMSLRTASALSSPAPIDRERQMETDEERGREGGQAFFNRTGGCAIRVHGHRAFWEKKACLRYQSVMLASSSTVSPNETPSLMLSPLTWATVPLMTQPCYISASLLRDTHGNEPSWVACDIHNKASLIFDNALLDNLPARLMSRLRVYERARARHMVMLSKGLQACAHDWSRPPDKRVNIVVAAKGNEQTPGVLMTIRSVLQTLKGSNAADGSVHFHYFSDKAMPPSPLLNMPPSSLTFYNLTEVEKQHRLHEMYNYWSPRRKALAKNSANYVRFIIADELVDVSTAIWLDADVLVRHDVTQLMRSVFSVPHGAPIAAVDENRTYLRRINYQQQSDAISRQLRRFNAGVVAYDLRQWRCNQLGDRVRRIAHDSRRLILFSEDGSQPLLSLAVGDHFERLDWRWNVDGLGWANIDDWPASGRIFHWTGRYKPWTTGASLLESLKPGLRSLFNLGAALSSPKGHGGNDLAATFLEHTKARCAHAHASYGWRLSKSLRGLCVDPPSSVGIMNGSGL